MTALFFRESGKTPKAQIAGNVALTSFRISGIFLHKAFRKFLAEAQRPIYAGFQGESHILRSPPKKILFSHASWVV